MEKKTQELVPIFVENYNESKYLIGCYANLALISYVVLRVNISESEFLIIEQGILESDNLIECGEMFMTLFDKYGIRTIISNAVAEIINSGGYISKYKVSNKEMIKLMNHFGTEHVKPIIWQDINILEPIKCLKHIKSLFAESKLKFLDDTTAKEWEKEFKTFNVKDYSEGTKEYPLLFSLWYALQFQIKLYPEIGKTDTIVLY